MTKESQLKKVLGDTYEEIRKAKVLLVGAGGIGCELLKDLVLMGYGEIHIVDLDTIDLSNLNRQFLFRQKDIKQPKATTAVNAVQQFNFHQSKLVPYMANIMDTKQFPLEWFDQFNFIFNALDNIQARSYVNKMCLFLKKPSIESGTTGFNGQVLPIFPYKTECYECTVKETPKTYPVCTIRSTPSQPVHCVTWAKNYLFGQLFGEDEAGDQPTEFGTDNEEEIQNLIKEQNELAEMKLSVSDEKFYNKVLDKIFVKDIEKLLKIDELWRTRKRPVPLVWNEEVEKEVLSLSDNDVVRGQDVWPIKNYIYLLIKSIKALQKRLAAGEKYLEFDKDDEDTLDFVVAATNIRSSMFHIPIKLKFDIKQIAGNIIPAIATTNSVISGFSALALIFLFEKNHKHRMVYTFQDNTRFVSSSPLFPANPKCKSCSIPRSILKINFEQFPDTTFATVLETLLKQLHYPHSEISVILGKDKLLYDVDFDDNKEEPIKKLGFAPGEVILVQDDNDKKASIELYILDYSGNAAVHLDSIELPDAPKKEEEHESELDDDDDGLIEEGVETKKRPLEDAEEPAAKHQKHQKIEGEMDDDGVVVLE